MFCSGVSSREWVWSIEILGLEKGLGGNGAVAVDISLPSGSRATLLLLNNPFELGRWELELCEMASDQQDQNGHHA